MSATALRATDGSPHVALREAETEDLVAAPADVLDVASAGMKARPAGPPRIAHLEGPRVSSDGGTRQPLRLSIEDADACGASEWINAAAPSQEIPTARSRYPIRVGQRASRTRCASSLHRGPSLSRISAGQIETFAVNERGRSATGSASGCRRRSRRVRRGPIGRHFGRATPTAREQDERRGPGQRGNHASGFHTPYTRCEFKMVPSAWTARLARPEERGYPAAAMRSEQALRSGRVHAKGAVPAAL